MSHRLIRYPIRLRPCESIEHKDNPLFVRRLKEDMKRFDGTSIFPPRHVHSVRFRLTEAEQSLYNHVTNYVRNYFDKAKEKRSISFATNLSPFLGRMPLALLAWGFNPKVCQ